MGGLLPAATSEKNGLMPAIYRRRITHVQLPQINTDACHVATYKKSSTYYGHVIRLLIGSFKTSCELLLSCDHVLNTYNFKLKGYGFSESYIKMIIVESDSDFKVYLTGSYISSYSLSYALIESTSDLFVPVDNGEKVQVSSLNPTKTIDIADSLIGG